MNFEIRRVLAVTWRDVPTSVWALGFVSLLMDVSSELIHSLLPVFLVTVMGASAVTVGLIEGKRHNFTYSTVRQSRRKP